MPQRHRTVNRVNEYARIRPVDLRRWPAQAARLKLVHEFWDGNRGQGGLPIWTDLRLIEDRRMLYGRFLGDEPTSFQIERFGAELRSPNGQLSLEGQTLADIGVSPYIGLIARDYHDIRCMGVPRYRQVYAEIPQPDGTPMVLHYIGGAWPISEDGKTTSGLLLLSAVIPA